MENTIATRELQSDTDWQALDIFIFTNGQQHSPPRKYHLQAEDISSWQSTLTDLAKSQYGSGSTVELYTTGGQKVTNPLELSNGGSYVAVQPPDFFVDAGYDRYLMKASRSWDKRQGKKIENSVIPEDPQTLLAIENITEVKQKSDIHSEENSASSNMVPPKNINQDACPIIIPPTKVIQRDSIVKTPVDKRKSSHQPPHFAKKFTASSSITHNRKSLKKGNNSKTENNAKITDPAKAINPLVSPKSNNSSSYRTSAKSKLLGLKVKSNETSKQSTVSPIVAKNVANVEPHKINCSHEPAKNDNGHNINNDKELVVVSSVYDNPDQEIPSIAINPFQSQSIASDPVRHHGMTTVIPELSDSNLEDSTHDIDNTNITKFESCNKVKNEMKEKYGTKIGRSVENTSLVGKIDKILTDYNSTYNMENNNILSTCNKEQTKNTYAHDAEVSLIEKKNKLQNAKSLRDLPSSTDKVANDQNKTALLEGEFTNIKLKSDPETGSFFEKNLHTNQINDRIPVMQDLHNISSNQIIMHKNSLISLIANELTLHTRDHNKILIYQLRNCTNHLESKLDFDKNCVICMPLEIRPKICCCTSTNTDNTQNNHVSKVDSCLCLVPDKDLIMNNHLDIKAKENNDKVVGKKAVVIGEGIPVPNIMSTVTDKIDSTRNVQNNETRRNQSSQTDWFNVLLEAKRLPDGQFTFRLPHLELLKAHNLT